MLTTTTVTVKGNLATDPELRCTPTGTQLAELRVLVNARRQNDTGEWEDTEPTRHRVTRFGTLAENVTASLRTGDRVLVVGRISTDTWTDKDTGGKRTTPRVLAGSVTVSWPSAHAYLAPRGATARPPTRPPPRPALTVVMGPLAPSAVRCCRRS